MSSESVECPLCMETMDFDDVDFFPCPCRYQICRFCWDKIINEENGLCPACRKPYNSENPASYKPRTEEEIKNKLKSSKKVVSKKAKQSSNQEPPPPGREYLAEYRVLQKNLIFVVGLPMRMADEMELLKGPDYFGKCGKVYKIVINQNQTFPGPQGTSCLSAYVTYHRNEDALKTLVDLKKLEIDGRAVKLSLGTTKYCSQFLRNRKCTKQDCMYLHELGDQVASFTREDMANGRHTEYENQLIQQYHEILKLVNVCTVQTSTTPILTTTTTMAAVSSDGSEKGIVTMAVSDGTNGPGGGGGGGVSTVSQRKSSTVTSSTNTNTISNVSNSSGSVTSITKSKTTAAQIISNNVKSKKSQRSNVVNQMVTMTTGSPTGATDGHHSENIMNSANRNSRSVNAKQIPSTESSTSTTGTGTDSFPCSSSPGNVNVDGSEQCQNNDYNHHHPCYSLSNDNLSSAESIARGAPEVSLLMGTINHENHDKSLDLSATPTVSSLLESFYQLNSQNHSNDDSRTSSSSSTSTIVMGKPSTGGSILINNSNNNNSNNNNHHHFHLNNSNNPHPLNQYHPSSSSSSSTSSNFQPYFNQQQFLHHNNDVNDICQQLNDNGLHNSGYGTANVAMQHHYPNTNAFRNDFNVSRFPSEQNPFSYCYYYYHDDLQTEHADIDFDPINISRKALEEMVAIENRQKMVAATTPTEQSVTDIGQYLSNKIIGSSSLANGNIVGDVDCLYESSGQQRQQRSSLLRSNVHDEMPNNNGSSYGTDFFSMNSRAQISSAKFEKLSPVDTRSIGQQQMTNLNVMGSSHSGSGQEGPPGGVSTIYCNNNGLDSSNTSACSRFQQSSPPPGFEPPIGSHNGNENVNGLGRVDSQQHSHENNNIMGLLMNRNNFSTLGNGGGDVYQQQQQQRFHHHQLSQHHSQLHHQQNLYQSYHQYNSNDNDNHHHNQFQINYNCQTSQISDPTNYHHHSNSNDFNFHPNGGLPVGTSNGLMFNGGDIISSSLLPGSGPPLSSSHSWKNVAQTGFIDCCPLSSSDLSHPAVALRPHRSHSVNDNNGNFSATTTGMRRKSEWNGFSNYIQSSSTVNNNQTDSLILDRHPPT